MLSEFSGLLLAIYRRAQESTVQSFQDDVLSDIRSVLPFDSSMWGTAVMKDEGMDIHSVHLHNSSPDMLLAYEQVKHQDLAAADVTSQPRRTIAFNAATLFADGQHTDIRRFCAHFVHENIFITSDVHPVTRFAHWVSLYRADPRQVCTDAEVEMLACLGPHLMQALAINRLVHLDRLVGDVARDSWSVAIADKRGMLYHADPRFRTLVRAEWPDARGDHLPAALSALLAGRDDRIVGRYTVLEKSLEHEVLFLKARERQPVDNLSTRELIVARLLVSGLTQKQVALKLERSPETIRSQVRVIFDKLGISNVVMLGPHLAVRG